MAKKDKRDKKDGGAPNPNTVQNRDLLQRLNFLYQASVYLQHASTSVEPQVSSSTTPHKRKGTRKTKHENKDILSTVSRSYIRTMRVIGTKSLVKLDPSIKRTLCKGCDTVLIPGATSSVRIKPSPSHGHIVANTCLQCKTIRSIPHPPDLATQPDTPQEGPNEIPTDIVIPPPQKNRHKNAPKPKSKSKPRAKTFFERDIGHVVFRGNETAEAS